MTAKPFTGHDNMNTDTEPILGLMILTQELDCDKEACEVTGLKEAQT